MGIMDAFKNKISTEQSLKVEVEKKESYLKDKVSNIHNAGLDSLSDWNVKTLEEKRTILLEFFDKSSTEDTVKKINNTEEERLDNMFYSLISNFEIAEDLNNKEEVDLELVNKIKTKNILNIPKEIFEMYKFLNPKEDDMLYRKLSDFKKVGINQVNDFFGKTIADKEKILLSLGYDKSSLTGVWGRTRNKDKDFNDRYIRHVLYISSLIENIPDQISQAERLPGYSKELSADQIKEVYQKHQENYFQELRKESGIDLLNLKVLVSKKMSEDFIPLYKQADEAVKRPEILKAFSENQHMTDPEKIRAYIFIDSLLKEFKKENEINEFPEGVEEQLMDIVLKDYIKLSKPFSDNRSE